MSLGPQISKLNLLKGNQKSPRTRTHSQRDLLVKEPHFAQKPNSSVQQAINSNRIKTLKQQDHNLCSFSTLHISEKKWNLLEKLELSITKKPITEVPHKEPSWGGNCTKTSLHHTTHQKDKLMIKCTFLIRWAKIFHNQRIYNILNQLHLHIIAIKKYKEPLDDTDIKEKKLFN